MHLEEIAPYQPDSADAERELLHDALMNTDVVVENPSDPPEEWHMSGRPLEIALVKAAAERGVLYPYLMAEHKIIDRYPFNPEQKFSAALYRKGPALHLTLLGAPEAVLRYIRMPQEERVLVEEEVNARAYGGERVLAVASANVTHQEIRLEQFIAEPKHILAFRGLISLSDPLRPETRGAVERILRAGVRTVILTGDHRGTAESIARELGLIDGKAAVLTGEDLEHLSPEELASRAGEIAVYARVSPAQKLMLTKLYKSRGEVVAVTGDGVNDAPALHAADIGVAVGSGTDVAKSAADLVLLDDNFNTLVTAIEEGRRIIDNIRKVIVYVLSNSLDALLLIGGALISGLALPLNAIQILFVNFFTDSFPAVALAFEEAR
jgi:Ca2+-transporting ATPase